MGTNIGLPIAAIMLIADVAVLAVTSDYRGALLHLAALAGVIGAIKEAWDKS